MVYWPILVMNAVGNPDANQIYMYVYERIIYSEPTYVGRDIHVRMYMYGRRFPFFSLPSPSTSYLSSFYSTASFSPAIPPLIPSCYFFSTWQFLSKYACQRPTHDVTEDREIYGRR